MPGDSNFPPQFAESCVSATIGQINDLAGPEEQTAFAQASALTAPQNVAGAATVPQFPVPVVITGSRPPSANRFPGLRETMIASAIIQLAEQVPDDNATLRESIIQLGEKLHRAGAEKILRGTIVRKNPAVRTKSKKK